MGAPRGRRPGFVMSDEHRIKIQNSNILNALIEHVEGKRDMSATQVTAGVALLRKVLPDVAIIEHTGEVEHHFVARIPVAANSPADWKRDHGPKTINGHAHHVDGSPKKISN
jgi:hypothetical protein